MAKPIDQIDFNELGPTLKALTKAGGRTDHTDWIRGRGNAAKLIEFIEQKRRLIDCDATPLCPDGWKIEEHRWGGQLEFEPAKIKFHLDPAQTACEIVGLDLKEKFLDELVLNACVLDHLRANPSLIPDAWKLDKSGSIRMIYFRGTVYRSSSGRLCVRYLHWAGLCWHWGAHDLENHWDRLSPAAILAV
jgi:hypothetical protein